MAEARIDTDRKPRSVAAINQPPGIDRHAGRIKRLKMAIKQAEAKGDSARVEALQAEIDRRRKDLKSMRDAIDVVL